MAQLTIRPIPAFLPAFTTKVERPVPVPYFDQGHVLTAGIGHTGPDVIEGQRVDPGTMQRWLEEDLTAAARGLARRVKPAIIATLSSNQYGALVDFVFNTGPLAPDAGIWKLLNAGNLAAVPAKLAEYDKYRDPHTHELVVSKGLSNRRAAEVAVWNTPDPADEAKLASIPPPAVAMVEAIHAEAPVEVPSSGFIRAVDTPAAAPPAGGLKAILTGLGGGLASAPLWIKGVIDTLNQWSAGNDYVAKAIMVLGTIGAGLAVASMIYTAIAHRQAQH